MNVQHRIANMAFVHQKLYDESNNCALNFIEFLESKYNQLIALYANANRRVEFVFDRNCADLKVSNSIPLDLRMNKLIIIFFKYAFRECEHRMIQIQIEEEMGILKICYSDNGTGIEEPFDLKT